MPDDLVDNLRYPEDVFRVQTNMWTQYHVEDASTFYNDNDAWNVALDPGTAGAGPATQTTNAAGEPVGPTRGARVDPYYLLTQLPDEDEAEFVMLRSFVPIGDDQTQQLTAFMVARMDPGHYGELVTYVMPRQNRPDGPAIVADAIQSDEIVSEQQTVRFGNLILVPVDNSLVYVRPFYVESEGVQIPELKLVIAFFEGNVAVGDTLLDALSQLFDDRIPSIEEVVEDPESPSVETEGPGSGDPGDDDPQEDPGTVNEQIAQLLEDAEVLFQEAATALDEGDLGEYQTKNDEAQALVTEALELLVSSTTATTSPSSPSTTTTEPEQEEA
jgi:hypothetical protein